MPGIGFWELAIIFLLLIVFVGPKRLPQAARTFGRVMGEVRRATDELKTALYLEEARQRRSDPDHDPYRRRAPAPGRRDLEHAPPPPDLARAPEGAVPAAAKDEDIPAAAASPAGDGPPAKGEGDGEDAAG